LEAAQGVLVTKEAVGHFSLFFSYTVVASEMDLDGIELSANIDMTGSSIQNVTLDDAVTNISSISYDLSNILVNTSLVGPDQVLTVNQTNLSEDRTEVTFNWQAPNDNGAAISHYSVRYKKTSESDYTYLSPNPTTTSAVISNLDPEDNYEVQVAAYNSVMGPYSPILEVSTFYNPATLGALIWYEARDINADGVEVVDGTEVTTLYDKSGNGNNAVKISGASRQP
jgi:hypothetical protein